MLKKLVGALLFSQAALAVKAPIAPIDRTNYHDHLCNEDFFQLTTASMIRPSSAENLIHTQYKDYCHSVNEYEKSLANAKRDNINPQKLYACADRDVDRLTVQDCIDKKGIQYAKTCETLKRYKKEYASDWNHFFRSHPTCSNIQRR